MKRYRFHQPIAGQCSISIPSENVAKPGLFDVLEGIEIEQWLEMCESLTSPVTKLWRTMLKNLSYVMSLCNGIRCMWCCFVIWYHLYNLKKWEKHPWRSCTFRACNFSKVNTPPRMLMLTNATKSRKESHQSPKRRHDIWRVWKWLETVSRGTQSSNEDEVFWENGFTVITFSQKAQS